MTAAKHSFSSIPQTDPKLDDIFTTWNVKVGDNVIVDASALSQMAQMGPFVPIVVTYGPSPITETFRPLE